MNTRQQILDTLRARPQVPVLILGGGVNGAGLLRELALQGVPALLADRGDFAGGATSKSSRMIHGGLRYLETREFALVKESLLERNRLLANAPHYVSPLKTTIPLYSRLGGLVRSALIFCGVGLAPGERGACITRMGLAFYDFVTRKERRTPTHFLRGREESLREVRGLSPSIVGTATYWDAKITQAERLCVELLADAADACPDAAALNYVAPEGVRGSRVLFKDLATGEAFEVEPKVVVNATGAWVDKTNAVLGESTRFMGGTKGSHLVLDCPALYEALGDRMVYYQHADGRVCIVFRFMDKVIAGSTDIPVRDPDEARCDQGEVDYMLSALRSALPGVHVGPEHIVFTYCGTRPLPAKGGDVPANISRGHTIHALEPRDGSARAGGASSGAEPGALANRSPTAEAMGHPALAGHPGDGHARAFPILCLVGGKWTTFRALAAQTADIVLARLGLPRKVESERMPIGGGRGFPTTDAERAAWVGRVAGSSGLPEARVATLLERYGTRAEAYAASVAAAGAPAAERMLSTLPDYSAEEVAWVARNEQVVHLTDVVYRRSTIGLLGHARPEVLAELARAAGSALGWDEARQRDEAARAVPEPVAPAAGTAASPPL